MTASTHAGFHRMVRSAARAAYAALTDRELLLRYASEGDQAAFAAVVARHTSMVLGVCRRALPTVQDTEDACQATFLVLARKAASTRWHPSVANWLYLTARRVADRARVAAACRRRHEGRAAVPGCVEPLDAMTGRELLAVLDEELDRLSPTYREPLVLCYLEGLTRAHAASRLGVPDGTVKIRLERGRKKLADALTKRGVVAGAGLLAIAATSPAGASPLRLVEAVLAAVAGDVPAAVATLAEGVAVNKSLWAAIALAGAVALGVGVGVVRSPAGQPPAKGMPAKEVPAKPQAAAVPPAAGESVAYSGTVVDADGRPVPRANVYFYFLARDAEPCPVRATTGGDGTFAFTLTKADMPPSAEASEFDPLRTGFVAKADGFTFAWALTDRDTSGLTLRVEKDETPLTGRVLDLEGKPLAGLRVTAIGVAAPSAGDLTPFVQTLQDGRTMFEALVQVPNYLHDSYHWRRPVPILPATTTDAAGRYRLAGFGRERVVEVRIEGDAVETQTVYVITRADGATLNFTRPLNPARPMMHPNVRGAEGTHIVLRNGTDHVAPPGLLVTGTVRDAATGQPVPGAAVESYRLARTDLSQNPVYRATADAAGRYKLAGLPRGQGNRVRVRGAGDAPLIPVVKDVPVPRLFEPALMDVTLARGVWVEVRAADKATGRPAAGTVSYMIYADPPAEPSYSSHPDYAGAYDDMAPTRADGTYRFPAVVGKTAVVAFRSAWGKYPIAADAPSRSLPSSLSSSNFQAFADLRPKPDDGPVRIAFTLDAGRSVAGRVVDPDGKSLAGVLAAGLRSDWFVDADGPQVADRFTAIGLDPARPRRLAFVHAERKLAGTVVVRGDEAGPVTVRLQPWGTVTGRLLGADGKPPAGRPDLTFTEIPPRKPGQPASADAGIHVVYRAPGQPERDPRVDKDGRFTADGLIPGLRYTLAVYDSRRTAEFDDGRWKGVVFRDVTVEPGETKDLGDVKLQPFPKE